MKITSATTTERKLEQQVTALLQDKMLLWKEVKEVKEELSELKSESQNVVGLLTSISAQLSTNYSPAKRQKTQLPPVPELPLAAATPAALTFWNCLCLFKKEP